MELRQLSSDTFQLWLGEHIYLALKTSLKDEILYYIPNADTERYGWIVRGQDMFPWKHKPMRIDDAVHIIGPYLRGITLAECLADNSLSLGYVSRLSRALSVLEQKRIYLSAIHTQAILFLADGGVLFLADETVMLLCKHQNQRNGAHNYQPFNHPMSAKCGYSNEDRYSFALAALNYRVLCGKMPWDVEDIDELREHMMSGILPTMHFYDPYIRPEIVHEIHAILSQPRLPPPPLKFWENFFHAYLIQGTHTKLNDHEVRARTRSAHIMLHRLHQSRARKAQLRKHSFRLVAALVFVLLIATVPYALTKLTISRPDYGRLSAQQMVGRYYDGVDTLDRAQVAETLHPDYPSPTIHQIETIYRASRVGMIFRFQNPYLDPESWVDSGRPRIGSRYSVYGIDDLTLNTTSRAEQTAQITATYRYWLPHQFAEHNSINDDANSAIILIRERLSLRMHNGQWKIVAVDLLSETDQ